MWTTGRTEERRYMTDDKKHELRCYQIEQGSAKQGAGPTGGGAGQVRGG